MTIEYPCDPQTRLISITCSGDITMDDRIHIVDHLLDAPDLLAHASILIDLNRVTNAPTNEEIV